MPIRYTIDDNGVVRYRNARTDREVVAWRDDIDAIAAVGRVIDRAGVNHLLDGNFAYRYLRLALDELCYARDFINREHVKINPDDYLDLLTAIEDLQGLVARIARIED